MKKCLVLLLVVVLGMTACQERPLSVGDTYIGALQNGETEEMLAAVSENVALVVDGNPFFYNEITGKEAMRTYYTGDLASSGFRFEVTGDAEVKDNQLTYPARFAMDVFKEVGVDWVSGKEVLTIEDGKVVRDVWTIDESSQAALGAAFAALEPTFADNLVGDWRFEGGEGVGNVDFSYHADGTYEMVRYIADSATIWDTGEYALEGQTITLTTTEDHYCGVGDVGVYEMAITESGQLESNVVDDVCWRRSPPIEGPIYLSPLMP